MIEVLISWFVIFAASLLFGYCAILFIYKEEEKWLLSLDVCIMCGLMILNVYAEIFSLFYKVGIMACFILFILGLMLLIILCLKERSQLQRLYKTVVGNLSGISCILYILGGLCILVTLLWTVLAPQHYDTALYHAQAVRWIEEYGVVPGLGNLHNRFAYNSAFMPLQALFSLRWLFDQSLHTLNGFLSCFLLIYAIATNNLIKRKKLLLSDFFKLAMIVYICINRKYISSLSSDILAMLLVIYIFAKWSELLEKHVKSDLPYAFYCMMAMWAATVKLSTATGVLLAIYPIMLMIKRKEYKRIIVHLGVGGGIAIPWLIRNVIISGYLLYPYSKLDLFNVDWKMLPSVLDFDKMEIVVWGRNVKDVNLYQQYISEWIGGWYREQSWFEQVLIILGFTSAIFLLGMCIYKICQKKYADILLWLVALIGLGAWFFSAPLLRYGSAYLLLPMCIVLAQIVEKKAAIGRVICFLTLIPMLCIYCSQITYFCQVSVVKQEDYREYASKEFLLGETKLWIPQEGDQIGYNVFPSTPYENILGIIELRGENVCDGFRVKEESREMRINTYGDEW